MIKPILVTVDKIIINIDISRHFVNFINKSFTQINSIDISISHCKEYAVANVVIIC